MPKMQEGNDKIRRMMGKRRIDSYVDVYSRMLGLDGKAMPDIFLADRLHMNRKGYEIWQPLIEAKLLR
jgi:lysophospholipase L1-like esterase